MTELLKEQKAGQSIGELLKIATGGNIEIFDARSIGKLKEYGFSSEELYRLVAPRSTVARRLEKNEPLTVRESDSAQRIIHISQMADRIFGDPTKAALNGVIPLDLLESETGARLGEDELLRIDYGIYI